MDFRNICQKLDVDGFKAKIPALPQLRLPKALPKLKSRKIFRTSRDNVNESGKNSPRSQAALGGGGGGFSGQPMSMMAGTHSIPPPSEFINHTPKRISTISSLMHEHGGDGGRGGGGGGGMAARSTYRSACSIDDDYPSPTTVNQRASRPISPIRLPNSPCSEAVIGGDAGTTGRMSFIEHLQKGYKDITEFRLKHIFAKKTIVRRDNIKVDDYVLQYDEERRLEQLAQERRDRKIADNYNINFTLSNTRQNTLESNEDDDNDSLRGEARHIGVAAPAPMAPLPPTNKRLISTNAGKTTKSSVGEHSGDESGMEATPPSRKPGIASTRFARVRSPPLNMASEDGGGGNDGTPPKTVADKNINKSSANAGGGYKQQLRRLKEYMSSQEESTAEQQINTETTGGVADQAPSRSAKLLSKLPSLGRNKSIPAAAGEASGVESETEQKEASNITNKPLDTIKQNIKRLHKSIKRGPPPQQQQQKRANTATDDESDDNEDDEEAAARKRNPTTTKPPKRTARFAEQLRRFRSTEEVTETQQQQQSESQGFGGKLQTWKKSFKKRGATATIDTAATTGDESSPEKQCESTKRPDTLMKKLKHIRSSRKTTTTASNSELDRTDDGAMTPDEAGEAKNATRAASTTRKNIEERLAHARDKTMKKVNEKMQQMKFFHKSQDQMDSSANTNVSSNRAQPETPTQKRHQQYNDDVDYNSSDEDEDDLHIPSKMAITGSRHTTLSPPTIERRHCLPSDYQQYYTNQNEIESIDPIQAEYAAKERRISGVSGYGAMGSSNSNGGLTAWTTKPILCEESLDSDVDSEFPRVLIHQDHSDAFESTLIIAVTRPASASPIPSARISEILPDSEEGLKKPQRRCAQTPPPSLGRGPHQWVSNDKIISGFLEISSPPKMHASPRLSVSDLDDGIDRKTITKKQKQKLEKLDPWQVQSISSEQQQQSIYKTKSIDIFETNARKGGVSGAFEDFDDELRNEPIVRIGVPTNDVDSFEHDSSEDRDAPDDDNSSRVTKICVQAINESVEETTTKLVAPNSSKEFKGQFGNSRESLIAHMGEEHDQSDEDDDDDEADEDDEEDDDDDDDEGFINDRPPSSAPSPPPSCSPPPPPLPERRIPPQTHLRMEPPIPAPPTTPAPMLPTAKSLENNDYDVLPPPLPTSKPPLPPSTNNCNNEALPKIPERTASISRPGKPLVKTSSLRLAYSEQVNPGDVGKVNKLISRFEPPGKRTERPRIISRRLQSQESEECSDDEIEEEETLESNDYESVDKRDKTPTPAATIKSSSIDRTITTKTTTTITKIATQTSQAIEISKEQSSVNNSNYNKKANSSIPQIVTTRDLSTNSNNNNNYGATLVTSSIGMKPSIERHASDLSKSSLSLDRKNSNCSRSEYGSPLTYPSSLRGSNETTPVPERKQPQMDLLQQQRNTTRRSRRSMTRDDENFYSFDSDEENSYYSISPSGSSRYVVEI